MTIKIDKTHKFILFIFLITLAILIQLSPVKKSIAAKNENTKLPVIMYHQITQRNSKIRKYCVSAQQLEDDLKYIKENGYETITINQLLDHVYNGKEIPGKPIMITFDDGFVSIKEYVLPLMKKYDMCCVASVVGAYADLTEEENDHNVNYAYLDWNEIASLTKEKYVEIQNHSYDMHQITSERKGAAQCIGEDYDTYRKSLSKDLEKMQNKIFEKSGYKPTTFAYPFGSYSKDSSAVLKELGFKAAFICHEVVNEIDLENKDWLFKIGRFNRSGNYTTENFFNKFE